LVPAGKGGVPAMNWLISALQAPALAGYQPAGNIRSRVRMIASWYKGRLITVGDALRQNSAYRSAKPLNYAGFQLY